LFGLVLSLTRAAIICTIITIFGYYLFLKKNTVFNIHNKWLFILIFCGILFFFLFLNPDLLRFVSISKNAYRNKGHIEALVSSVPNIYNSIIIGNGIGTAGVWTSTQGNNSAASESAYLSLMYQIGGSGLLVFISMWFVIIINLYKKQQKNAINFISQLNYIFIFVNFGYIVSGIISEQIFTFSSVAHFWFLNGALLSQKPISCFYKPHC
jgi:hypothetical protein